MSTVITSPNSALQRDGGASASSTSSISLPASVVQTVAINLADRSYPITIAPGLLATPATYAALPKATAALIVTNTTVAPLYADALRSALAPKYAQVHTVVLPDGEEHKNWQTLNLIFDALLQHGCDRKTVLFVTHDIDEAVFMGSRVVVMSARPGRIKLDRVVPLAHPRHYSVKTTPAFAELKAELTEAVREEVLAAQAAANV